MSEIRVGDGRSPYIKFHPFQLMQQFQFKDYVTHTHSDAGPPSGLLARTTLLLSLQRPEASNILFHFFGFLILLIDFNRR